MDKKIRSLIHQRVAGTDQRNIWIGNLYREYIIERGKVGAYPYIGRIFCNTEGKPLSRQRIEQICKGV